jgi:para-aminobenzoate synthetase component 1
VRPLLETVVTLQTPETLLTGLAGIPGVVLLRSGGFDSTQARYSFVAARPFLTFRSSGSRCEVRPFAAPAPRRAEEPVTAGDSSPAGGAYVQFGNPWHLLDALMSRYEVLEELDLPFPVGGAFGYWGYELKNFTETKLSRRAVNDLELPDSHVGFYDSLVVFDHRLGKTCVVSTGLAADGSRTESRARERLDFWRKHLSRPAPPPVSCHRPGAGEAGRVTSSVERPAFLAAVARAQSYIRAGDIYQVNLSQRLGAPCPYSGRELFARLLAVSPAPFAAYLDCGDFELASSSPEQFLAMSGAHVVTRPIKGTRPRSVDATRDAQLAYELQTSPKELAELVMITDLLRNDLGRVCEYGSVQVPELAKLERFAQVQHLVSTVEGRLRPDVTHFAALAAAFPGGSITGAPKFRAMEIIDELEPVTRGPYCGCHGYLGFNRESQLSISIRTAILQDAIAYFPVGAGIVADSSPEAEYDETLAKAAGFLAALQPSGAPVTSRAAP